ncbi:MAG: hypothetical protein OEW63_08240 [Gammaproteobacteria bacterium]|nr:hypothetical protein [Gammaproteobacteria bacterium]
MTRDKLVVTRQERRQMPLALSQSGNVKAARMTISVATDRQSLHNDRWSKTLQMYSDYLIRY